MPKRSRWSATAGALLILVMTAIAGCGARTDPWSEESIAAGDGDVRVQLLNSQVAVGHARLEFELVRADGVLLDGATGMVRLFWLSDAQPQLASEVQLVPIPIFDRSSSSPHNGPLATVYVATADIARPGRWGAQLLVQGAGHRYSALRSQFVASPASTYPGVGMPVPLTRQRVLADVQNIADIDSSAPPRPFLHVLTVADAVASGRPTVVAFATPAFCERRFCGPVIDEVVVPLAQRYGDRANFLHIEPYRLADARQGRLIPAPEMAEWGLAVEPMIFVIDRTGRVAAVFEGVSSPDEVGAALERTFR